MHMPRDEASAKHALPSTQYCSGGAFEQADQCVQRAFQYLEARESNEASGSLPKRIHEVAFGNNGGSSIADECRAAARRLLENDNVAANTSSEIRPATHARTATPDIPVLLQANFQLSDFDPPATVWQPDENVPPQYRTVDKVHNGADMSPWELYTADKDNVKELIERHVKGASEDNAASAIMDCFWTMIHHTNHLHSKEKWLEILQFVRYVAVMHQSVPHT